MLLPDRQPAPPEDGIAWCLSAEAGYRSMIFHARVPSERLHKVGLLSRNGLSAPLEPTLLPSSLLRTGKRWNRGSSQEALGRPPRVMRAPDRSRSRSTPTRSAR